MKIKSLNAAVVLFMMFALLIPGLVTPYNVQSQEFIPDGINPLSKRTAILSFPLSVFPFVRADQGNFVPSRRFQELEAVTVVIEDRTDGRDAISISDDFLPLTASALSSGLALFKESGAQPGSFNFQFGDQNSDTPLDLFGSPIVEQDPANPRRFFVTFTPVPGSAKLTIFQDQFPDFFVVAQTSLNILHGDRFEVSIPANGIKIRDLTSPLPDDTLFDVRFPGPEFGSLNPEFARPAIFEGDLFELFSFVNENDNTTRIDASSEPTSVLSLDFVGRKDQGYFLKELQVNWIGLNLGQIARLMANRSQALYSGASTAGLLASLQAGQLSQVNSFPSFFYSPWFYNFPTNPETGEILIGETVIDGEVVAQYPITAPLDPAGFPLTSFILGFDDLNSHVTSFVSSGPRLPNIGIDALTPNTVSQDILQPLSSDQSGGIFLYRELGGSVGKFDRGVDQIIKLNPNNFRVEPFPITPEDVQSATSPIRQILKRLVPGVVNEGTGLDTITYLFEDSNLAADLMGVTELPDAVEGFRAPYGTLACYEDPDCLFFDLMINVLRPYLGLTEGQVRYLAEFTEDNGITNMEELFGFPIVQGFSYVLPIAQSNALSNISAPASRVGDDAGPDIYIAIRTSDRLRALDSFIPFIRPQDISVGTNVVNFTQGSNEGVQIFDSVSSIGVGRRGSGVTFSMIGRPKPRFQFEDLTQPGPSPLEANRNNILFDSSLSSPPKAVIGINAIDFGQFSDLVQNSALAALDNFDVFFDESAVLSAAQIEFLPTTSSPIFDPLIFNAIPVQLQIDLPFSRVITQHNVAFYKEDDTPLGNGFDDDFDGLIDEEEYNLVDDDGDGLIDEDLGDGTPAGTNGVFDSFDNFLPNIFDEFGVPGAFDDATYVFPPNDQDKFQPYIDAIQPVNNPVTIAQGGMIPLNFGEGSWFTELDFTALNFESYNLPRTQIVPSRFQRIGITPSAGPEFDPPLLNQGTFTQLQPYMGLMDLVKAAGIPDIIPEDDIIVVHPDTGEELFLLLLTSDDGQIPILADPDGDPRRTILLSLAAALRFPNTLQPFVRVGSTPLLFNVGGPNGSNPNGDNIPNPIPIYQNGFFLEITDADTIGDYITDMLDTLADSIESAVDLKADFEEQIADITDDAASQDPPEQPDFSDLELPDPVEISFADPYEAFGINDFLEANGGQYQTNYQYQVQLPDENFGPLAGNDYYVVLRAGDTAQTGDSFRVRIRSGQRNRQLSFIDPADNTVTVVDAPEGGIGFQSFIKTDPGIGSIAFPNVSKNQITTGPIVVRSANVPPQIQFTSPGAQENLASEDFTFDIIFQASDLDNVATVRLFVDTDSLDFDGAFIPGASLREGFDTSFTLDLRNDIEDFDPELQYFIYAEISDGVNAPVLTYADGPIVTIPSSGDSTGGDTGGSDNVVVEGNLQNFVDYVKLTSDGRLFNLGDQPSLNDVTIISRSTDMEKVPSNSGAIVVQDDGKVIGTGTVGVFQRRLQPNGELAFDDSERAFFRNSISGGELIAAPTPGQITIEFARDIEVDFANGAVYVMDGDGDMLYLGNADSNLRPPAVDIDLYRDMELSPDGSTMYFLTGNGMFSTSGPNVVGDWNDLIAEDKYRDLELLVDGSSVSGILVTDDDGKVSAIGSSSRASTLISLANSLTLPAGSVRQIKTFSNDPNTLIMLEGSGQVTVASDSGAALPRDPFIFAEDPGIDNDAIVDVETSSINLQTVVEISREILRAFSDENINGVMKHISPKYKDIHGNTAASLQRSLTSIFNFFEIDSYSQSNAIQNPFTLSSAGSTVTANIFVDFAAFVPDIEYTQPDIQADSQAVETIGQMLFNELPFDQTIRIREVSDGRSWTIEFWEIREFGRNIDEFITADDLEFEDITFLTQQTSNRRVAFYQPRSRFVDPPVNLFINKDERNPLAPVALLAIFRENAVRRDVAPPVLEVTAYFGSFFALSPLNNIQMEFQPNEAGVPQITRMFLSQFLAENADADINLGDTTEPDPPLAALDGQTATNPMGFSFEDRGPVTSLFPGEADVILQGGELLVTNPLGGVMTLPQNTDIFAANPQQLIRQFSRSVVRTNPFDTNTGQTAFPGFSATAEAGRSYLVLNRDGRTFGLIELEAVNTPGLDDGSVFILNYRFEDSFVLPANF